MVGEFGRAGDERACGGALEAQGRGAHYANHDAKLKVSGPGVRLNLKAVSAVR